MPAAGWLSKLPPYHLIGFCTMRQTADRHKELFHLVLFTLVWSGPFLKNSFSRHRLLLALTPEQPATLIWHRWTSTHFTPQEVTCEDCHGDDSLHAEN